MNSKADFNLKDVGLFFGGKVSAAVGDLFLKILSLALLCAFTFGASSILRSFLQLEASSFNTVVVVFTGAILLMFLLLPDFIIKINKHAFTVMFFGIIIGVISLAVCSDTKAIPLGAEGFLSYKSWSTVFPIVFTSFGFHNTLHSVTKFVDNDRTLIRRACLFGSLIPAFVYCTWTVCILVVIFNADPASFSKMLVAPIDVSELVGILSAITKVGFLQHAVWGVSFLAILTSIFGSGLALNEIIAKDVRRFIKNDKLVHITSTLVTIIPAATIVTLIPNAFIRVLNFAGIIAVMIVIFIPVFLYAKMRKQLTGAEHFLLSAMLVVGISIVVFGISDIIMR
jgi:tyrosine-specific transport protein